MNARRPGLSGLVNFETRKFASRALPWCLFALIAAVTLVLGLIEIGGDDPAQSHGLYAHLISRSLPLTAFLAMILGALGINHEIGTGSLRALLLRPVRRREVVIAKTIVILAFSLAASLIALLSAWAFTAAASDFSAIVIEIPGFEPREVISATVMRGYALKLSVASVLPIMAAASFGVLVSVLVESEGSAVAGAIVGYLAMQALGPTLPSLAPWLFPSYLELNLALLGELAREDQSHEAVVLALGPLSRTYLAPLGMALVFGLGAVIAFERKDLPC